MPHAIVLPLVQSVCCFSLRQRFDIFVTTFSRLPYHMNPLSPHSDENEISLYIITDNLFERSSDKNNGSDQ